MRVRATLLVRRVREVLTMRGALPERDAKGSWDPGPLGVIEDGAVAVCDGVIAAVGSTAEVERSIELAPGATVIEGGDRVLAPGLVDAHTHALFAGDRAHEFSLRVQGRGYADIAAAGGGIASTVRAVRAADDGALRASLEARVARMRSFGVTAVEVKTGYALDTAQELRCLDVMAGLDAVVPTFLPLHAVPPELRGSAEGRARYLALVADEMLPAALAQGRARFIDAYIDGPGFSVAEARPTLERARAAGLRARLHVGQFEDIGGAELAAELGAASADHLEHVSDAGLSAMASAGVTAVLLPGAAFSLGQPMPDARRMRALGVSVALATDCNPGTSRTENLPLMAAFGVRQMGLTTVEAWWALTRVPAESLGLGAIARIVPGAPANLSLFDLRSWEALAYVFGVPLAVWTCAGRNVRSFWPAG